MSNVLMGSLDGDLKKIAFDVGHVKRILPLSSANVVHSDNGTFYLEWDGGVYPVECGPQPNIKPYFIVLNSSEAFNVSDHRMLFEVSELPNNLVMGTDIEGDEHLCVRHSSVPASSRAPKAMNLCLEKVEARLESGDISSEELQDVKNMIKNLRNGHFFEELTSEFSGKIKEIAVELIDFRRDIKKRIEPGILEIASKDIPEASNQLEGINDTLEKSTMKIMDINEEQMDLADSQVARLRAVLDRGTAEDSSHRWERAGAILLEMKELGSRLPEEARQVMDFVMPGLDAGRELMAQDPDIPAVEAALSEGLITMEELSRDVGPADEAARSLGELCGRLKELFHEKGPGEHGEDVSGDNPGPDVEALEQALKNQVDVLRTIGGLCLKMMEPLSFQDLVGQRIQRIIQLVKTMEMRIEDLIISFGIKMRRHKEDPAIPFEDLDREVEHYKSFLKGPQSEGEGLDQEGIDALLATL